MLLFSINRYKNDDSVSIENDELGFIIRLPDENILIDEVWATTQTGDILIEISESNWPTLQSIVRLGHGIILDGHLNQVFCNLDAETYQELIKGVPENARETYLKDLEKSEKANGQNFDRYKNVRVPKRTRKLSELKTTKEETIMENNNKTELETKLEDISNQEELNTNAPEGTEEVEVIIEEIDEYVLNQQTIDVLQELNEVLSKSNEQSKDSSNPFDAEMDELFKEVEKRHAERSGEENDDVKSEGSSPITLKRVGVGVAAIAAVGAIGYGISKFFGGK